MEGPLFVYKDNYSTNYEASDVRLIIKILRISIIADSEEQYMFVYDALSAVMEFPGWLILVTQLFTW